MPTYTTVVQNEVGDEPITITVIGEPVTDEFIAANYPDKTYTDGELCQWCGTDMNEPLGSPPWCDVDLCSDECYDSFFNEDEEDVDWFMCNRCLSTYDKSAPINEVINGCRDEGKWVCNNCRCGFSSDEELDAVRKAVLVDIRMYGKCRLLDKEECEYCKTIRNNPTGEYDPPPVTDENGTLRCYACS